MPEAKSGWMRGGDGDQKRLVGGGDVCVSGSGNMAPALEGVCVCECLCRMCVPVDIEKRNQESLQITNPPKLRVIAL